MENNLVGIPGPEYHHPEIHPPLYLGRTRKRIATVEVVFFHHGRSGGCIEKTAESREKKEDAQDRQTYRRIGQFESYSDAMTGRTLTDMPHPDNLIIWLYPSARSGGKYFYESDI